MLGTITGLITDPSGAVVPNAHVTLTETATGITRTTVTNPAGLYTFAAVPLGTYVVTVEQSGFRTVTSSPIVLTAMKTVMFNAKLEVGSASTKVQVTAAPPTINTTNASISTTMNQDELVNLPINNNRSSSPYTIDSSVYGAKTLGGQRSYFGYYSVDGVSAMMVPWGGTSGPTRAEYPLGAIAELKITENSPSAEYQDLGNVSIVTRAGTNTLHGALFDDEYNNAFNARSYFGHSKGKGPTQHIFGGSLGGPVVIPHLYNGHDKTFFFVAYEHHLYPASGGGAILTTVPTLKMRQGDFSELLPASGTTPAGSICAANPLSGCYTITDPYTGSPYTGNGITDPLSKVSLGIQDFLPEPNYGPSNSIVNNFNTIVNTATYDYRTAERVDEQINPKDNLTWRMMKVYNDEDGYEGLPTLFDNQYRKVFNISLQETHTFGPTLVNDARVGYQRDSSFLSSIANGSRLVQQWGLEGLHLPSNNITGLPQITFNNFQGLYDQQTQFWANQIVDYLDNLTWMKGKHEIKIGTTIWRNIMNVSDSSNLDFGAFGFNGFSSGFDYADFLLGIPRTAERYTPLPNRYNRSTQLAFYGQDSFAVTPKLTLNFGLRWQKMTAPVDKNNMRFAYDPATGQLVVPNQRVLNTLVSPLFAPGPNSGVFVTANAVGYPANSLMTTPSHEFAPNFGFAYRPFSNSRTVVRGGYSISYSPFDWVVLDPFQNGPFNSNEFFTNSMTGTGPAFSFPDPFPGTQSAQLGTENISGVTEHPREPYTQQWSLGVEHEFPFQMVAHVRYMGSRTLQLLYGHDLTQPPASTNPANENLYLNPNFNSIMFYNNGGSQMGNLLNMGVQRQFTSGLMLQAGYTWARVLTDMYGGDLVGFPEDPYNFRRDWGPGNGAVVANRFTTYGQYGLPFGTGKRFGSSLPGFVRQGFGNWQVSWLLTLESGQYITPHECAVDTPNNRSLNYTCLRPDVAGNWAMANPGTGPGQLWFNPTAFVIPANGTYGNASNGMIFGPGHANFDFGLFKYFTIRERARLEIRMTATNFFNHPNFSNPNTNITSLSAGVIRGISGGINNSGPRQIVLGASLDF